MPEVDRLIYLDNAATTYPKPECVYEAADEYYRRYGGNAGRGSNPLARKSADLIAKTRALLSGWLGAPSPEHIIFTPSATIALNLALLGMDLRSGQTVYVSPFEHNSVLRPLEHLHQTVGVAVQEIPFDYYSMSCHLDRLAARFRAEPPVLVCITQASNVCGIMPPIVEISKLAKQVNPNAIVVVDGAQTAGLYHLPLVDGLVDALVFSAHKSLYGPYGIAGLVLASDWRPRPILFGGTGTNSQSLYMPSNPPSAYEAGSHNVWAIAGLKAALEWLRDTGREAITMQTLELAKAVTERLKHIPGIQIHMPPNEQPWCGIISFAVENAPPQAIEAALAARDIAVRSGLHCAPGTHKFLGTCNAGGSVRLSPGYFNQVNELTTVTEYIEVLALSMQGAAQTVQAV